MRKHTILLTALLAVLSLLTSCTELSGVEGTRYYEISNPNYYYLDISDRLNVIVTEEVSEIVITADESILDDMEITCTNGRLRIYRKGLSAFWEDLTEVLIPYNPNLHEIHMSTSTEFYTPYGIAGEDVKIVASNSCKFDGYINADNLKIQGSDDSEILASLDVDNLLTLKLSSNSKAELEGYSPNLAIDLSSGSTLMSDLSAGYYTFECDYCYGSMSSNSTAYFHCFDRLAVTLTENSFLYYTGDADDYECLVDGSSDVIGE